MRSFCLTVLLLLAGCGFDVRPGARFVRKGVPEELLRQAVAQHAVVDSTLRQQAAYDLLGRDLLITIDQVDSCRAILERYAEQNRMVIEGPFNPVEQEMLLVRPVVDPSPALAREKCFSYIVRYRIPLPAPLRWDGQVYYHMDLRLAFLHPLAEAREILRKP